MTEITNKINSTEPILAQERLVHNVNKAFENIQENDAASKIDELREFIIELKGSNILDDEAAHLQNLQALISAVAVIIDLLENEIHTLMAEADDHVRAKTLEEERHIAIYKDVYFDNSKNAQTQLDLDASMALIKQYDQAMSAAYGQRVIYQADKREYEAYRDALQVPYSIVRQRVAHLGAIAMHQEAYQNLPAAVAIPAPPDIKRRAIAGTINFSELDTESYEYIATGAVGTIQENPYVSVPVEMPIFTIQPEPVEVKKVETRTLHEILADTPKPTLTLSGRSLKNKASLQQSTIK